MRKPARSVSAALDLAERASRGDRASAYELARLVKPGSVSELVEFVEPDGPISTRGFDAVADGFALFVKQRKAGK